MHDVFLSYAADDTEVMSALVDGLETAGFSTWCYERDGVPGPSYLVQTGGAISECQAFLLLISNQSLGSHQITRELVRAHEEAKPILPVLVDVSHLEFQKRQPEWREALGAATSVSLRNRSIEEVVRLLVGGLEALGIEPRRDRALSKESSDTVPRQPSVPTEFRIRISAGRKLPDDYVLEAKDFGVTIDGRKVLSGLSFALRRGEVFGVVGISGAGKSVLADAISGTHSYQAVSEGALLINSGDNRGDHATGTSAHGRARASVELVRSLPCLHGENVLRCTVKCFLEGDAPPPDSEDKIARRPDSTGSRGDAYMVEVLAQVGLWGSDLLLRRLNQLSRAQLLRVRLARSLLSRPTILVLDGVLDTHSHPTVRLIMELLRNLSAKPLTIVVVSHDVSALLQWCDRIGVLIGGRLVEIGTPASLSKKYGGDLTALFLGREKTP